MVSLMGEETIPKYSFQGLIRHHPVKRSFDVIFSILMLFILFPLYVAIALAIKLTSRGPIVYSHPRIGRGGQVFRCYKFRTMHADADERLEAILAKDPIARDEWERTRKLKDDPRITKIGSYLRKSSLDELPQFWNVIKGELSVVGPRPVVEHEVIKFLGPKASKILSVRPGLTCLWQVSGRSDTCYQTRVALDEQYVDKRSLRMDIKLIAQTVPAMFSSRGAY